MPLPEGLVPGQSGVVSWFEALNDLFNDIEERGGIDALSSFVVVNVKTDKGAIGSGAVNDGAALQAAADELDPALGGPGGIVFSPPGIYRVGDDNVTQPVIGIGDNTTVMGAGPGSIWRKASALTGGGSISIIANKRRQTGLGGTGGATNKNIVIRDMQFDGFKETATTLVASQQVVSFDNCEDSALINLLVINAKNDNVVVSNSKNITLDNVESRGAVKSGIYIVVCDRIILKGCKGRGHGAGGIGSTFIIQCSWFVAMSLCEAWDDVQSSVQYGRDTQFMTITGCIFGTGMDATVIQNPTGSGSPWQSERPGAPATYNNEYQGIYNCTIVGNTIYVPAGKGTPGIGLRMSNNNVIADNRIHRTARWGIYIHGGNRNRIRGNIISNAGMDAVAGQDHAIMVVDRTGTSGVSSSDKNTIEGNTVFDSPKGIFVSSAGGSVAGNKIRNNDVEATEPYSIPPSVHVLVEVTGTGSPETVVPGGIGSRYIQTDATATTSQWVKTTTGAFASTTKTGWKNLAQAA